MKMLRLAVLIALGGCAETGDNAASIVPERVSNETNYSGPAPFDMQEPVNDLGLLEPAEAPE